MRLLVVEDDPAIRHLLDRLLTERGHHVITAPRAEEMAALLLDFPDPPDLALLDVVLPDMSGIDFADQLARQFPRTRVVFMTGWLDPAKVDEAEKRGPLLMKPFKWPELLAIIDPNAPRVGGSSV